MSKKIDTYYLNHAHTDISNLRLLDSINKVDQLIDYSIRIGLSGVSITDHEALSNHVKALEHMKKLRALANDYEENTEMSEETRENIRNFRLGLGNEIYLVRDGLHRDNFDRDFDRYFHFILVAKDKIGHEQLRLLSTRAWLRSYYDRGMERVPTYYSDIEEIVGENPGHLIATTACLGGYLPTNFMRFLETKNKQYMKEAVDFCEWGREMFGEDFYIELQPTAESEDQINFNNFALKFAEKMQIKPIVATDAHYLSKADRAIHKEYLDSKGGEREVDAFYSTTYVMSAEEIYEYMLDFHSEEEVTMMLENTFEIRDKIEEYDLASPVEVPKIDIPEFVPDKLPALVEEKGLEYIKEFFGSDNMSRQYLLHQAREGLKEKNYDEERTVKSWERLDIELKQIADLSARVGSEMSDYFLTVQKIIDIIWTDGDSIIAPSRGSALGFELCNLLGITQISPIDKEIPLPFWRFLTGDRASLPDIDIDTQSFKRERVVAALQNYFGEYQSVAVATFSTEGAKGAVQTAARGLGMEPSTAQYITSLIPNERGKDWTLSDCYYGNDDPEINRKPVKAFIQEINKHENLWEVANRIEGIISGRGSHPGGVIITNSVFTDHSAFMRAPKGMLTAQFDLEDSEKIGGLKFDLLSTRGLDRIRLTMDLLIEHGFMEDMGSLRENYNTYLHPDVINYTDEEMWEKAVSGEILALFQFDTPVGGDAIRKAKPKSLLELAVVNSVMRLSSDDGMAPIDVYTRQKEDIKVWYREMQKWGLNEEEVKVMEKHLLPLYGVADSQESAMLMVMDENVANFSLGEADKLRKGIAKKLPSEIEALEKLYYTKGAEQGTRKQMLDYIWKVQLHRQFGYSFSSLHTYAYSTIAVQEMNLYHFYPSIFWNTANLIVESRGIEEDEDVDEIDFEFDSELEVENRFFGDYEYEDEEEEDSARKTRSVEYGKIAVAIGQIQERGVEIGPPHINDSDYTFTPNAETNTIMFGIKGISGIGDALVEQIMENRPYSSVEDVLEAVPLNKPQTVNLIKSGAFDEVCGKPREEIMRDYISSTITKRNAMNGRNIDMLIRYGLVPDFLSEERAFANFTRYIRQRHFNDGDGNIILDERAQTYLLAKETELREFGYQGFDIIENIAKIERKEWTAINSKGTQKLKDWIAENEEELIEQVYNIEWQEMWDKYCLGSISKWEMDSVGFYRHDHELKGTWTDEYEIVNFFSLPAEKQPSWYFEIEDKSIPMYDLFSITGTVLDKQKNKGIVTILTTHGVVPVRVWRSQYSMYDKQVTHVNPNTGKKTIVERSWFTRGNKLIIHGMRDGDNFIPKKYKSSPHKEVIALITGAEENGKLKFQKKRIGQE